MGYLTESTGGDSTRTRGSGMINLIAGVLLIAFGVVWFVLYMDNILMPTLVKRDTVINIPDLRGMPVRIAESLCAELGIELVRKRNRIDNHIPGVVVDQFPVAGSRVKPGRLVEVVLSMREPLILCPNVTGKSPLEAKLIADSAGLNLALSTVSYRHSAQVPEGVIIAQNPRQMTGLARGDSISITVSLGTVPAAIKAPSLVGRNLREAELLLAKYFLRIGRVTHYPDKAHREGTILEQTPSAATPLRRGVAVDLIIAVKPATADGRRK